MELIKISEKLNTQAKCMAYLEQHRWPEVPICPYCNSTKSSRKTQEFRHTCHNCKRSYSVLVGTIFESTKLPITKWFFAISLILNAKKGISSLQLARDLHVNKNTAWFLQKRIRKAMKDDDHILNGIVEIDETYVGGSISNKNYFTKLKVAEIKMESGSLRTGEPVYIMGPTTGVVEMIIPEIRVALKKVDATVKGEICSVPVGSLIRRADKIYKIIPDAI